MIDNGCEQIDRLLLFHLFGCIVSISLFVSLLSVSVQNNYIILERDPRHDNPVVIEQISSTLLTIICLTSPIVLVSYYFIVRVCLNKALETKVICRLLISYLSTTYLSLCLTLNMTQVLKLLVSEPRPNFYHMCNYQHINDNRTYYESHTNEHNIVNYAHCFGDYNDVQNARSSFPSGHASSSFVIGMSLVFILQYCDMPWPWCYLPLLGSAWIAWTRIMDSYHSILDVSCGTILGCLIARLVWGQMHVVLYRVNKLLLDNDEGKVISMV